MTRQDGPGDSHLHRVDLGTVRANDLTARFCVRAGGFDESLPADNTVDDMAKQGITGDALCPAVFAFWIGHWSTPKFEKGANLDVNPGHPSPGQFKLPQ